MSVSLQISQYYGHWSVDHPDVSKGRCVKSVLHGAGRQVLEEGPTNIDIAGGGGGGEHARSLSATWH